MASYHDQLKALAESIGSDGCSHVLDICVECCWEHDWAYVTGMTPRGVVISKEYADRRFRDCIQAHLSLRFLNPLSWWRWLAVKYLGRGIWNRPVVQVRSFLMSDTAREIKLLEATRARTRILEQLLFEITNE